MVNKAIFHDPISIAYLALGGGISVFFSLYSQSYAALLPATMFCLGFILMLGSAGKVERDEDLDNTEKTSIFYWTMVGTAALFIANLAVQNVVGGNMNSFTQGSIMANMAGSITGSITGSQQMDLMLFTVMMALAEEQFFRGGLLRLFTWKSNFSFAILGTSLIFMFYHFKVYGTTQTALMFVLLAGAVLAFITLKSQRLVPAQHAHVVNNLVALMGSII